MDESVQMGPLQNAQSKERVLGYIEKGVKEGATLALDGRNLKIADPNLPQDCFLNPSVFVDLTPEMTLAREEIFGPVAGILRAANIDRAISMIHDNPYGNAAAIYTSSGQAAQRFRHDVKCGNIGINIGIPAPVAFFPFGGMKDSFFGTLHGQGKDAIRFFTEAKVVVERWF